MSQPKHCNQRLVLCWKPPLAEAALTGPVTDESGATTKVAVAALVAKDTP